jgi:hypothetical protein
MTTNVDTESTSAAEEAEESNVRIVFLLKGDYADRNLRPYRADDPLFQDPRWKWKIVEVGN